MFIFRHFAAVKEAIVIVIVDDPKILQALCINFGLCTKKELIHGLYDFNHFNSKGYQIFADILLRLKFIE